MLEYNPEKRISAADAYKHSWFKGKDFNILPPEQMQEITSGLNEFYVIKDCNIGV